MSAPANIRINTSVPFPSLVFGSGPITIGKTNGVWTVGFSINIFGSQVPLPGNYTTDFLLGYDSISNSFFKVSLANLISNGTGRRVTAAGAVTVNASTDDRIYVAKTVEAATSLNLPTVAARIAAGGAPYFIKNEMSNGALYPLTPTPSGSEKIEGVAAAYTMDSQRQGLWFWPDDSVTPNNWEIR